MSGEPPKPKDRLDIDNWIDIVDIIAKIATPVLLFILTFVVSISSTEISKNLKRGELIKSVISELSSEDLNGFKRNLAMIVLDSSDPVEKPKTPKEIKEFLKNENLCKEKLPSNENYEPLSTDNVLNIAVYTLKNLVNSKLTTIKTQSIETDKERFKILIEIIYKRSDDNFFETHVCPLINDQESSINRKNGASLKNLDEPDQKKIEIQKQVSRTFAIIQPIIKPDTKIENENLKDVRLVFIQYSGNNNAQALKLQKDLQALGISAPGIEQVEGIEQNNIRYANSTDKVTAEKLKVYLLQKQKIDVKELIDLSMSKYTVQSGQFEIWLKDSSKK